MPTVEKTPLQKALKQHLGPHQEHLIPLCTKAVSLGQIAANGDYSLFGQFLETPNGRKLTVEEVITNYHLNSFIEWGGGEI